MFTQCPECLTVYAVTPETLAKGRGSVRCAHCSAVFDALRTLTDTLPGRVTRLDAHLPEADLPNLDMPVMRPVPDADAPAHNDLFTQAAVQGAALPQFTRTPVVPNRASAWPWRVGVALLIPLLIAQVGYAERFELQRNATSRPWLELACVKLGCTLPLPHDADGLALLSRDVRPHPSVSKALIISATLRNNADHTQAFPTVEITLTDLDEHRIAMRRFRPSEYVGDARTIHAGLTSGASTALVFEVADPGKSAVAYEFRFL
ncbi:MAG: zinc-ribbon and DUF3426 domain-containing protein [Rudaea sp.]